MGWLIRNSLDHVNNYINEKLRMRGAKKSHVDPKFAEKVKAGVGAWGGNEYLSVWYVGHNDALDTDYIGLMLLTFDPAVKEREDVSGVIYDNLDYGRSWPMSDVMVQGWGVKDLDCCSGPGATDVPLEFLDIVPPHNGASDSCEQWRERVRKQRGQLL